MTNIENQWLLIVSGSGGVQSEVMPDYKACAARASAYAEAVCSGNVEIGSTRINHVEGKVSRWVCTGHHEIFNYPGHEHKRTFAVECRPLNKPEDKP